MSWRVRSARLLAGIGVGFAVGVGGEQIVRAEDRSSIALWKWCAQRGVQQDDLIAKKIGTDIDPNTKHPLGWTPLMIAAWSGNRQAVTILLESGASVNVEASGKKPHPNLFHNFPVNSVSTVKGFTALHFAILSQNINIACDIISAGADITRETGAIATPETLVQHLYERDPNMLEEIMSKVNDSQDAYQIKLKEQRRIYPVEEHLKKKIVGQLGPIHAVGSAIRRKENGWCDTSKPLVFLFLGSSGIGKTELGKQVSKYLEDRDNTTFIRIDMSEYQHSHEVSKFIGSPPGYVGHEQGGQLTKKLTDHPKSIVLLDEVEKAHPDVLTILLQVFDDGRITDGQGTTVDCSDAIFIMTSNLAQTQIADEAIRLRASAAQQQNQITSNRSLISRKFRDQTVQPILKRAFKRDEFLGRINETVFFLPFTDQEIESLIDKELTFWKEKATKQHNMTLTWSKDLIRYLKGGYNVRYGARSLAHEIERTVVSKLALEHEQQRIGAGYNVHVDFIESEVQTTQPTEDGCDTETESGVIYSDLDGDIILNATPPSKDEKGFFSWNKA